MFQVEENQRIGMRSFILCFLFSYVTSSHWSNGWSYIAMCYCFVGRKKNNIKWYINAKHKIFKSYNIFDIINGLISFTHKHKWLNLAMKICKIWQLEKKIQSSMVSMNWCLIIYWLYQKGREYTFCGGFGLGDKILDHSLANVEMTSVHIMKIFTWM